MAESYIPERGDLVWLSFTPQAGHEQKGKRPALIISPLKYNKKTKLALCLPVTSKEKGYLFEVAITGTKIKGVILSDHIKNLDWKARNVKFIEKAADNILEECIGKISTLLF